MANYTYRIEQFVGLDQSRDESIIAPGYSPDAMNMDASDGSLAVTKGFSKRISEPIPTVGRSRVNKLLYFRSAEAEIPMAITGGYIYNYDADEEEWTRAYSYTLVMEEGRNYSVLMTRIGTTDVMLIADGANRILKFDGTSFELFGSSEGCSDVEVSYIAMFRNRLFAAGNYEYPNRLYYSKLPGGGRTIEDWGPDEDSTAVEGGHVEIGTTSGDPITALAAMSNQLLIFKKSSIYRLIGDRPGNFTVELIASDTTPVSCTATAVVKDVIYYVTKGGLHCFNGVSAAVMPDASRIKRIMDGADTSDTRLAVVGDRLYFTVRKDGVPRLIEYSLTERRYMQYGGFDAHDVISLDGRLVMAVGTRYVETWGEGESFDGEPIDAYWCTPLTDLGVKSAIKTMGEMYLRGEAVNGGRTQIEATVGGVTERRSIILPKSLSEVAELPLKNEGRTFKIRISNRAGSRFRIVGGLEMDIGIRKRTE